MSTTIAQVREGLVQTIEAITPSHRPLIKWRNGPPSVGVERGAVAPRALDNTRRFQLLAMPDPQPNQWTGTCTHILQTLRLTVTYDVRGDEPTEDVHDMAACDAADIMRLVTRPIGAVTTNWPSGLNSISIIGEAGLEPSDAHDNDNLWVMVITLEADYTYEE